MKKIFVIAAGLAAAVSLAQASACPEANYDGCYSDGYGIVEVEPNTYWPHNQMEAAHWVGYHYKTKKTYRRVRHHVRHHVRRRIRHTCR